MEHGLDAAVGKDAFHRGDVSTVPDDHGKAARGGAVSGREVVEDEDLVAGLREMTRREGADVAQASGDEEPQGASRREPSRVWKYA